MADGYWVVRTYEAGAVGEKTKFWVQGARPDRRSRAKEKSEAKKQTQNEYQAVRNAARIINANFGAGDLLLGLDYSNEGMTRLEAWARESFGEPEDEAARLDGLRKAAERELKLCLRRVKRELKRDGIELRFFAITSDMNGKTGEAVRVHHHLIIGAEARSAFVKKWEKLGGVAWSEMKRQIDYTDIAEYLLRQVRHIPDAKKYISSRNLIRPEPTDRIAISDAELRVPKGGKLLHRGEYRPGQAQYIRFMLPREKWKRPDEEKRRRE